MLPDASDIGILQKMYLEYPANQEALHRMAYDVRCALAQSESRLARCLTESGNYRAFAFPAGTAAVALLGKWKRLRKKRVITTHLEHPAVDSALAAAEAECIYLKTDCNARVLFDEAPEADALFLHHVQSEIGVIQDLDALFAKYPDALKIADTIQSAGKIQLPRNADVLTVSGAKFGMPGAAALLVKKEYAREIEALIAKERADYRVPRLIVPNFLAMSEIAEKRTLERKANWEHVSFLQSLCRRLASEIGLRCTVDKEFSSAYICHISLDNADGAVVVRLLSDAGICVGAGTACSAETGEPSKVLRALGYSRKAAFGGLRISFSYSTCENDVKKLFEVLEKTLKNY